MTLVRRSNWHFQWFKTSSLAATIRLIDQYNAAPSIDLLDRLETAVGALSTAKQIKYDPALDYLDDEIQTCRENIVEEQLQARLKRNQFRIGAGLNLYAAHFPGAFADAVCNLGSGDVWLDAGAGMAVTMREYLMPTAGYAAQFSALTGRSRDAKARCIAIGYEKPDDPDLRTLELRAADRFVYHSGKFFGEFSNEELGVEEGEVDLITDYNGVLFYTHTLSEDLQRYLDLISENGVIFIAHFGVEIDTGEETIDTLTWLQQTTRVAVEINREGAITIRRTSHRRPRVLNLRFESADPTSSPPMRRFSTL